jgi:hypothetical protein
MATNLEDLGILVGLLLTDGCVSSSRFIVFHNKSEVMHKLFQQQIVKVFGNVHFTERIENNGTKRTQVTSKVLVRRLLKICCLKTFRRKQFENGNFPPTRLPNFIKALPRVSILKILQVIFSADGSISVSVRWHKRNKAWEIRRRIELSCKHPILRNDFFKLIKSVGFSPRISSNNITLERKDDILKFARQVRFVPGVKIGGDSDNWKGFEKNQILDLAVKTLDLSKDDLKNFATKREVINFLKSFL